LAALLDLEDESADYVIHTNTAVLLGLEKGEGNP
jgi:hypothetical protein